MFGRKVFNGCLQNYFYFNFHIPVRWKVDIIARSDIESDKIELFSQSLEINASRSRELLTKYQKLRHMENYTIKSSIEKLISLNYEKSMILENPFVLYVSGTALENRYEILKESGCSDINFSLLLRYLIIVNRSISLLKTNMIIPRDINVQEKLESCFKDIDIKLDTKMDDTIILKSLRKTILQLYLRKKLKLTDMDMKKFTNYSRLSHKSFRSITEIIDILMNELDFKCDKIIKNSFLLYADPENLRKLLSINRKIGNEDIKSILYRRPKVMMSSFEAIMNIIENIKSFNIPESSINLCLDILTLSPDTVLSRLKALYQIEEFEVLISNPRILRLVHYQNKAMARLDYLNKIKVRCASLHVLSGSSSCFAKFAREGMDRTRGRDIVVFLANYLKRDFNSIRSKISRHPNWCHIPVTKIRECCEFLQKKLFPNHDIFFNIHIVLYPIDRIEEKLGLLQNSSFLEDNNIKNPLELSNREILALCLYLIELEFHFTGDGVWTEPVSNQVENFKNILLDLPEQFSKEYRFGPKSTKKGSSDCTI